MISWNVRSVKSKGSEQCRQAAKVLLTTVIRFDVSSKDPSTKVSGTFAAC
jgi:hypothetical protein